MKTALIVGTLVLALLNGTFLFQQEQAGWAADFLAQFGWMGIAILEGLVIVALILHIKHLYGSIIGEYKGTIDKLSSALEALKELRR